MVMNWKEMQMLKKSSEEQYLTHFLDLARLREYWAMSKFTNLFLFFLTKGWAPPFPLQVHKLVSYENLLLSSRGLHPTRIYSSMVSSTVCRWTLLMIMPCLRYNHLFPWFLMVIHVIIFRRIIWFGDLNYRINLSYERAHELISKQDWDGLFENDQVIWWCDTFITIIDFWIMLFLPL